MKLTQKLPPIIPLGTKTKFGEVTGVQWMRGERYYWLLGKDGVVSRCPDRAPRQRGTRRTGQFDASR